MAAAGTTFLVLAGPATASSPSLCAAGEDTVFSCRLGEKTASLCASKGIGPDKGYLAYRFGRPGRVEIDLPQSRAPARQAFTEGVEGFSGGGTDWVRIRNGPYGYVVYSGMGKGWSQDGVAVEKDGKIVSNMVCPTDAMGPNGWARVYDTKMPMLSQGFEMPEPSARRRGAAK